MRIGILGGTFDPVHYGHLLLAECGREQCNLDQVWLVPNVTSPHKTNDVVSKPEHRLEMLRLATAGNGAFRVVSLEIQRGGVSYSVDTLREIHQAEPEAQLFLLLGADSLADLPRWREPARICELAIPVAVRRPDHPEPDLSVLADLVSETRMAEIRQCRVDMPLIDLSATDLRRRAAHGESLRYRTPRAVQRYIQTHGVYRA